MLFLYFSQFVSHPIRSADASLVNRLNEFPHSINMLSCKNIIKQPSKILEFTAYFAPLSPLVPQRLAIGAHFECKKISWPHSGKRIILLPAEYYATALAAPTLLTRNVFFWIKKFWHVHCFALCNQLLFGSCVKTAGIKYANIVFLSSCAWVGLTLSICSHRDKMIAWILFVFSLQISDT